MECEIRDEEGEMQEENTRPGCKEKGGGGAWRKVRERQDGSCKENDGGGRVPGIARLMEGC